MAVNALDDMNDGRSRPFTSFAEMNGIVTIERVT
jgi:hypothetical protein